MAGNETSRSRGLNSRHFCIYTYYRRGGPKQHVLYMPPTTDAAVSVNGGEVDANEPPILPLEVRCSIVV